MNKKEILLGVLAIVAFTVLYQTTSFPKYFMSAIGVTSPVAEKANQLISQSNTSSIITNADGTTTITGMFLNGHADNFKEGKEIPFYSIRTDDGTYLLSFDSSNTEELKKIEGGSIVSVSGNLKDKLLKTKIDAVTVVSEPQQASNQRIAQDNNEAAPGPEVKKVAVILFNFQDDPTELHTKNEYRHMVYDKGSDTVEGYFDEVSHGKLVLQGKNSVDGSADVYGWYTIPYSSQSCPTGNAGGLIVWGNAAEQLAKADGFDLSGYNLVTHIFPRTNACGWGVSASEAPNPHYTGAVSNWLNGAEDPVGFFHEYGHAFGLGHANSLDCINPNADDPSFRRVSISNNCAYHEYGDPYDVMGKWVTTGAYHYSNGHLDQLDFIPGGDIKNVISSGVYTLLPVESSGGGTHSLRIPFFIDNISDHKKYNGYYLEYRQPYGWDKVKDTDLVSNGISVRLATKIPPFGGGSNLIDTTPKTATYLDSPLAVGKTFTDENMGVIIKTLAVNKTSAQVQITLQKPICIVNPLTFSILNSVQTGNLNQTLTYNYLLKNNDTGTCPPRSLLSFSGLERSFLEYPLSPFSFNLTSFQKNLNAGESFSGSFSLTSPSQSYAHDETFNFDVFSSVSLDGFWSPSMNEHSSAEVTYKLQSSMSCYPQTPTVSISPTRAIGRPGDMLIYKISITNNNSGGATGCGPSNFNISAPYSSGVELTVGTATLSLDSGETKETAISVTSSPYSREGIYSLIGNGARYQKPLLVEDEKSNLIYAFWNTWEYEVSLNPSLPPKDNSQFIFKPILNLFKRNTSERINNSTLDSSSTTTSDSPLINNAGSAETPQTQTKTLLPSETQTLDLAR